MQFSLRCDEEMWELTDHEKEVNDFSDISEKWMAKFYMVPIGHIACFPYYLYLEQLCVVDMFCCSNRVTAGRLGLVSRARVCIEVVW